MQDDTVVLENPERRKSHAQTLAEQGWKSFQDKDYAMAEDVFLAAIAADAGNPGHYRKLACALIKLHKDPQAVLALCQALGLDPAEEKNRQANTHYTLGRLLERMGRSAEALAQARAAFEKAGTNGETEIKNKAADLYARIQAGMIPHYASAP